MSDLAGEPMPPDTLERGAKLALKDSALLRQQCYIDGRWADADAHAARDVINPATGVRIGTVPVMGAAETRRAIDAANKAWPAWRARTAKERSAIMRKWAELQLAHAEDLALILTSEQGKPLAESKGEITIGAGYTEWFAEEAKRIYGDVIPTVGNDRRLVVIKEPVGVCAAITPWNFPSSMITRKVSPALAAGCTVIIKPAQATPYSALALAKLAEKVRALKVGPGTESGVAQGPLINADALAKVEEHVADATAHGARVAVGGKRHALGGTFYEPTILTEVTPEMKVFREETFGPVAPLFRFSSDAEVIELANRTEFGLASYFYSRDIGRIWRVAEALEYGMVGVNTGFITTEVAPFGGVKQSGIGREGSKYGIEEYIEVKYICMGGIDR